MLLIKNKSFNILPVNYPVVTLGNFDGIHKGHAKVIEVAQKKAKLYNGKVVVVTFEPHPEHVLNPVKKTPVLTTLEEKKHILENLNVDICWVIPFTKTFSKLSAEGFLKNYIIEQIHPKEIILGHDHRFGKNGKGDFQLLKKLCGKWNIKAEQVKPENIKRETISSTFIRKLIVNNKIEKANLLLGHPYIIRGSVISGKGLGKKLGYPTINIKISNKEKLIPTAGIYHVKVKFRKTVKTGALYIGKRPSFKGSKLSIEVHILNFNGDLYGEEVLIYIIRKIREDRKFENIDKLVEQIKNDIRKIKEYDRKTKDKVEVTCL